jgi:predicted metal-dependent hydrolase
MSEGEVLDTAVGPVRLRRTNRKTLAISVHPDGTVELTAPQRAEVGLILAKVAKRTVWIRRQQRTFIVMNAKRAPLHFSSGATHRYLGRQYRLKVIKGKPLGVKLSGGFFRVTVERSDEADVERLVSTWLRERASEQFTRRIEKWRTWCQQNRLPSPYLVLRTMPKRWGSAQINGQIALNPKLVRAPSVCIDYVIAHEICHLKHPDHGTAFYRQLGKLLPDWPRLKRRLEEAEL